MLTPEQEKRLAELEKNVTVTWHDGERDIMDVAYEYVISYVFKTTGIRLTRKVDD